MTNRAKYIPLVPIVVVTVGVLWITLSGIAFQKSENHELRGIIGYHYSMPEWGFQYRPGGEQIERWLFTVPASATVLLAGVSLIWAVRRQWNQLSGLGLLGIALMHLLCVLAFLVFAFFYWAEAANVFI